MSTESLDTFSKDFSNVVVNENDNNDQNSNFSYDGPSLYNLPIEIFLNICSYLSPIFISGILAKVCTRFKYILTDESLWRSWVSRRLNNKKFPPMVDYYGDIDWERECVYIDRLNHLWTNHGADNMTHIVLNDKHYASVDGILLMENASICVSGGRDRTLAVWDLKVIHQTETAGEGQGNKETAMSYSHHTSACKDNAHEGWVWGLASPKNTPDKFYSASWDGTVKLWNIRSNELVCTHTFKCSTSALSMSCIDENVIAVGLFSPNILLFDKRAEATPVQKYKVHKASILDLHVNQYGGNTLYSTSEDQSIVLFDLRAGETVCKKKLQSSNGKPTYGLCLAVNDEIYPHAVFAGDTMGNVHLLNGDTLQILSSTDVLLPEIESSKKVTDLSLASGALMASFESGDVRIMNPSCPPNFVTSTKSTTSNITTVLYENDVLAVATCDSAVEVWIPTDRLETY